MHRDLVERRRWIAEDVYRLALAFAQIMPGPLAAQCAIALGYFEHGLLGATFVGLAFVAPSFVMVVFLSMAYVAFGGLWWMQALFYGIGAAVISIIAIAAYKLGAEHEQTRSTLLGHLRRTARHHCSRPGGAGGLFRGRGITGACDQSAANLAEAARSGARANGSGCTGVALHATRAGRH
jgi:hypothetical protein